MKNEEYVKKKKRELRSEEKRINEEKRESEDFFTEGEEDGWLLENA
jgi:hypothetical protein